MSTTNDMMPKDPAKAEETRQKMREAASNRSPECRANISIAARLRWEKPGYRERQSESQKKAAESKEARERLSINTKRKWEDPDWASRVLETHKLTCSTSSYKERRSEIDKQRGSSESYKRNASIGAKKRFENPQERMRVVESRLGGFWYGNIRYYDDRPVYCEKFNRDFKGRVRAFWNYTCVECGAIEEKEAHHIHHVHYDKKMCCNGSPRDVVPLCRVCHTKTNYNRDYWEEKFTRLIAENGGKCFFTKEEMAQRNLNNTSSQ